MLAIVSSDMCYIKDTLQKLSYKKENSPYKTEVYKCNYKNHEFIIMSMGYGKINIGSSLRYLKEKYDIKVVLIVGSAGSITDYNPILSAVIPYSTLEFDVDFTPNGYLPSVVPNLSKGFYKTDEDLLDCLKKICLSSNINYSNDKIATSDMYVCNYGLASSIRREYNAGAVDCESGSVGEFCYINNIPYACIKIISNFANNASIKQYNLNEYDASKICSRVTYKFIKKFYEE